VNEAFQNGFRSELLRDAFVNGFRDEAEKLGMDKEALAFLPLLAAGALLAGGATAVGATGFGRPKGMPSRRYFSFSRDAPKIFGHFGKATVGAAFPGSTAAIEGVSMAAGGPQASWYAPQKPQRALYRAPTISGLGRAMQGMARPAGAF
jgi:hypothetical protein